MIGSGQPSRRSVLLTISARIGAFVYTITSSSESGMVSWTATARWESINGLTTMPASSLAAITARPASLSGRVNFHAQAFSGRLGQPYRPALGTAQGAGIIFMYRQRYRLSRWNFSVTSVHISSIASPWNLANRQAASPRQSQARRRPRGILVLNRPSGTASAAPRQIPDKIGFGPRRRSPTRSARSITRIPDSRDSCLA